MAIDHPNSYAIDVQNLTVGYGSNVLMKDLNFTVNNGEIFVILGGSGCGKSSLLKNLFGLYEPLSGDVFIEGQNITEAHGVERQKIMTSFGVMYQQGALFGSMNLLDNVTLFMQEYTQLSQSEMDLLARCKLDLVGLLPYESYMPSEISGGMQKRAAIARAMALDPKILFLIVGLQLYVIYVVSAKNSIRKYDKKFSIALVVVLLLTVVQVVLGTYVREFIDTIEKSGAPKSFWLLQPEITFYFHRSFSIVVFLANLFLLLRNRNLQLGFEKVNWVVRILIFEIISGVIMVYVDFPFGSQTIHLLLATFLFSVQFYLLLENQKVTEK
jgi:phospholipid/cholesterol/gamma-HCH transport system ATP-binding protein